MRRSHDALERSVRGKSTGEVHLRHHVSPDGFYRGRKVIDKGADVILVRSGHRDRRNGWGLRSPLHCSGQPFLRLKTPRCIWSSSANPLLEQLVAKHPGVDRARLKIVDAPEMVTMDERPLRPCAASHVPRCV